MFTEIPGLLDVGTIGGAVLGSAVTLLVNQIKARAERRSMEQRIEGLEDDIDTIYGSIMEVAVGDVYDRWRQAGKPD